MTDQADDDLAAKALLVAQKIGPILYGIGPELQGAILAELTSMWLAGHHPEVRTEIWDLHKKAIMALTSVNAKRMPWGR